MRMVYIVSRRSFLKRAKEGRTPLVDIWIESSTVNFYRSRVLDSGQSCTALSNIPRTQVDAQRQLIGRTASVAVCGQNFLQQLKKSSSRSLYDSRCEGPGTQYSWHNSVLDPLLVRDEIAVSCVAGL